MADGTTWLVSGAFHLGPDGTFDVIRSIDDS